MKSLVVKKSAVPVVLSAGWDSPMWAAANEAKVDFGFPDKNSDHTPDTRIRMLHDGKRLCGLFQVHDRYVAARCTADQQSVCRDSCVEFFTKPAGAECYFNFEINCGGTMLLYRCVDLAKHDYIEIPEEDMRTVERYHTMPRIIEEEITEPVTWYIGFAIPVTFFQKYAGASTDLSGQVWKGNFSKCADCTSHPTWLSWSPLSRCSFHLVDEFGQLIFE